MFGLTFRQAIFDAHARAMFRQTATQLQEDQCKSNLIHANQLVDKIEELNNNASNLSAEPFEKMKEVLRSWWWWLHVALEDCNDGEIATGDLALISSCYTPKVQRELYEFLEEFKEVEDALAAIKLQPFQELGGKMANALGPITPIVKELHRLPDKLHDIANQAKENKAPPVADFDSIKVCLTREAEMNQFLRDLEGCWTELPELVATAKLNYRKLLEFFNQAEGRIRDAFAVPPPCGCMTRFVVDQPHIAMTQLNEHSENAKSILNEFKQFADLLDGLQQTLVGLHTSKISVPVTQFSLMARQKLECLNKFVNAVNPAHLQTHTSLQATLPCERMMKQVAMVPMARPRRPRRPRSSSRSQTQSPRPCSGRATPLPFAVPRGSFGPEGAYADGGALRGMVLPTHHGYASQMAVKQLMWQGEISPPRAPVPSQSPRNTVPAGIFRTASSPCNPSLKVMHADSPRLIQGAQSCNAAPFKMSELAKTGRRAAPGYPVIAPKELSSTSSTQCPSLQGSFRSLSFRSPPSSVTSRMPSGDRRLLFDRSPRGSVQLPVRSAKLPVAVATAQELPMTERQSIPGAMFPPGAGFPLHTSGLVAADSWHVVPAASFSPGRVHQP